MTPRGKKTLFNVLRISICAAALWFVAHGVTLNDHVVLDDGSATLVGAVSDRGDHLVVRFADGREQSVPKDEVAVNAQGQPRIEYGLKTAWRNSIGLLFVLACCIHFPVTFLQAIRLRYLLRAQQIHIGYWHCVKFSFAGNFLNFATPLGSNAGDLFKAYFVATHTDRKTEGVTTIVLDRLIGLGTLIASVALITTVSGSSRLAEFRPFVLGALGAGIVAVLAYRSATLRKVLVPRGWLERLPMFAQLQRIDQTAGALASRRGILVGAVILTLLLQGTAIAAYFTVAIAMGLDAHAGNALEYFAYFYTGAVIQALPGPPQGLGTVELAYSYFLAPFGSPSQIICFAFAARVVVLVCALPGLWVTLTGSYRPSDVAVFDRPPSPALPAQPETTPDLITPRSCAPDTPVKATHR